MERDRDTDANGSLDERLYATQDANWNVTGLITTAGAVAERFSYDAYGNQTVLSASWASTSDAYAFRHGFQGGKQDPVTGLIHFQHRDYSPTLQRWVEQDYAGGYVDGLNLYQMVRGNPEGLVDPQGNSGIYTDGGGSPGGGGGGLNVPSGASAAILPGGGSIVSMPNLPPTGNPYGAITQSVRPGWVPGLGIPAGSGGVPSGWHVSCYPQGCFASPPGPGPGPGYNPRPPQKFGDCWADCMEKNHAGAALGLLGLGGVVGGLTYPVPKNPGSYHGIIATGPAEMPISKLIGASADRFGWPPIGPTMGIVRPISKIAGPAILTAAGTYLAGLAATCACLCSGSDNSTSGGFVGGGGSSGGGGAGGKW